MRTRLATALTMTAVAVAAVACGGERSPTLGPLPAASSMAPSTVPPRLADAQSAIRRGLASLRSFRADVIVAEAGRSGEFRFTFERTATGTFKEVQSTPSERVFFSDPREGRKVTYSAPPPDMGRATARQETNVPVGPPARPAPFHNIDVDPVVLAREVLGWEEARVGRDEVGGRAVWVVQGSTPNMVPELRVVTIDDQTGLALRYDALQAGQPAYQIRVENLAPNLEAEPSYVPPPGTPVSTSDAGHTRTTLDQAARAAGFAPLVPAWLPPGFTQAEVAVTTQQARGPRLMAVAFRRGMDLVLLQLSIRSTAPRPPMTATLGDRIDPEGNLRVPPRVERIRLSAGALAGVDAERMLGGEPWVSADTDTLTVRIGGDATPEEITRMAESLQHFR